MKLEKVNEHQIRCTLTKADLADRELKLSELAYGTEKAKSLFRDMMQQAAFEFGFEAEDIPLMIEAIPLSSESIVLIITKVEDPEELDTRFSNFVPSVREDDPGDFNNVLQALSEDSDVVSNLLKKLQPIEDKPAVSGDAPKSSKKQDKKQEELSRAFSFDTIESVARVAHILEPFFFGRSSLYRNDHSGRVILVISKGNHTTEDFSRACNIVSEYGQAEKYTVATEAYFKEHNDAIMTGDALSKLLYV